MCKSERAGTVTGSVGTTTSNSGGNPSGNLRGVTSTPTGLTSRVPGLAHGLCTIPFAGTTVGVTETSVVGAAPTTVLTTVGEKSMVSFLSLGPSVAGHSVSPGLTTVTNVHTHPTCNASLVSVISHVHANLAAVAPSGMGSGGEMSLKTERSVSGATAPVAASAMPGKHSPLVKFAAVLAT